MSKTQPIELLFGTYRRKILSLLLLRPDEEFHVREIARLTGVPAGSLHRELKQLAEAELLIRNTSGRQVYYRVDRTNPIYAELAGIFRKTAGQADIIRQVLAPLDDKIELAFIFGSAAKGTEHSASDIDLFVVGETTFAEIAEALIDTHQRLGREINPVIMRKSEFKQKYQNDPFIMRVVAEEKIYVRGRENDFGELVKDRSTE